MIQEPSSSQTSSTGVSSDLRGLPRRYWLGGAVVAVVAAAAVLLYLRLGTAGQAASRPESDGQTPESAAPLPVTTVRPQKKTLEWSHAQPVTIEPWTQADLYAKASGYLKRIQHDPDPAAAAGIIGQRLGSSAPPLGCAVQLATAIQVSLIHGPEKDIGSEVRAGEVLLEIASPEREQEIAAKESLVTQRRAELEAARASPETFSAAVEAARAQQVQAQAEVRKGEAEHSYRSKELAKIRQLVASGTLTAENGDEKEFQTAAALAAWESSKAKVQTLQAELTVVSSKLTVARADLKVKETLVRVADDELRLARILADYSRIEAPFDGIITYRGIDCGAFVQNATSGQSRRLMTITALDRVKVVLDVPEKKAFSVRAGTPASIYLDAHSNQPFKGRVTRTANTLDEATRTLRAEIDLENPARLLSPGMYGSATLILKRMENAQAVPATAVYSAAGKNYVLQVRDGRVRRVQVAIRYDDGKELEVVKLVEGREIALDGSEELIVGNKGEIADGQLVVATMQPVK